MAYEPTHENKPVSTASSAASGRIKMMLRARKKKYKGKGGPSGNAYAYGKTAKEAGNEPGKGFGGIVSAMAKSRKA